MDLIDGHPYRCRFRDRPFRRREGKLAQEGDLARKSVVILGGLLQSETQGGV
jgi:hypothetical protein